MQLLRSSGGQLSSTRNGFLTISCRLLRMALQYFRVIVILHRSTAFNAALAAGKRAITRDVLHTAIVGLALAIQYRHPTTRALASQAEWRPLLEFVCQQPGYGPFWGSKLAYDLRRVSRARLRPRDRFAFCRWRLAGRVPGLRRITGRTTLEPAVCLRAGGGLVRSNAIWNSITSNGGSANSAKPPNRSGTPSSSLPQRESLGAQPLCSHAAFLVFRHFFLHTSELMHIATPRTRRVENPCLTYVETKPQGWPSL